MELQTKNGIVKIYADTIEQEAISQITEMANSPIGENAHIRIMPDAHAGAGCVIGTALYITDKVCPSIVGVDIGCGVDLVGTTIDFRERAPELDAVIREYIPFGQNLSPEKRQYYFSKLRCWDKLPRKTQEASQYSMGTLGGGNHFIEAYDGGFISVHTGSRNIGFRVANYYQSLAVSEEKKRSYKKLMDYIYSLEPILRDDAMKNTVLSSNKDLTYLTGQNMDDYLHDVEILQEFARVNREFIINSIVEKMGGKIGMFITSVHNYIDMEYRILRKGAISAKKGQLLLIPINMRDGILVATGKGNEDWNYSAPHGAGRLYSRSRAKSEIGLEDFIKSMEGVYTTCVSENTIDESPMAYKNIDEILGLIEPTVLVLDRLSPIFNFKA